jgi:hypothetical protein
MTDKSYRWTKTYVVQTDSEDPVQPGDHIHVDSQGGGSEQLVLSVTTKRTKTGKEYKVLVVEAL